MSGHRHTGLRDTGTAIFLGQLRGRMVAWEETIDAVMAWSDQTIDTIQISNSPTRNTPHPDNTIARELNQLLVEVERDETELRRQFEVHARQAIDWEQKATLAWSSRRPDLAAQAIRRRDEHRYASEELSREAGALARIAERCREMIGDDAPAH